VSAPVLPVLLSTFKRVSNAGTNAALVAAGVVSLRGYYLVNTHATLMRYVKLYDKASQPNVGTDTPKLTLGIPPGSGANLGVEEIDFELGIGLALTTGPADSDLGAIAANEIIVNLYFV